MASHMRRCFRARSSLCSLKNALKLNPIQRACSGSSLTAREIELQNDEFNAERRRQIELTGRIEKIVVNLSGPPQDATLYMNKGISTPYDCGRHTTESVVQRAALALIDSKILWDMHKPLTSNCDLKYLYFDDEDPEQVNNVFWESCCFILGAVISNAFKNSVHVMLHSYPPPDYRTGSFAYDVQLSLDDWSPSNAELRVLTKEMMNFCWEGHNFERLDISKELALTMFEGNPFKERQINKTAVKNEDHSVTVYRIGKHIDICNGPLMSHTKLVNICSITAVHKINTSAGLFYRFQGIALPKPLVLNHFAYGLLENRAKKLNPGRFPEEKVEVVQSG